MKKTLLSMALAVMGISAASAADQVYVMNLNMADAYDIVGTYVPGAVDEEGVQTAASKYLPLDSLKVNGFQIVTTTNYEGTSTSYIPSLVMAFGEKGQYVSVASSSSDDGGTQFTLIAPEGVTMTNLTIHFDTSVPGSYPKVTTGSVGRLNDSSLTLTWSGKTNSVGFIPGTSAMKIASIDVTYTGVVPGYDFPYTLRPAAGASVDEIDKIYINFGDVTCQGIIPDMANTPVLYNTGTQKEYKGTLGTDGTRYYAQFGTIVDGVSTPINKNGNYTLTIPRGAFALDNKIANVEEATIGNSSNVSATYKIVDPIIYDFDFSPAANDTVSNLNDIRVKVAGVDVMAKVGEDNIVLEKDGTEDFWYCSMIEAVEDGWYKLNFYDANFQALKVEAPGTYTLKIAKGALELTGDDPFEVDKGDNQAVEVSWTIEKEYAFEFTPADGATLGTDELWDIYVDCTNASTIAVADGSRINLVNGENEVNLVGVVADGKIDYMILTELAEGEWTATIAANSLILDGAAYPEELKWSFTLLKPTHGPDLDDPTPDPAPGEVAGDALDHIVLTLPDNLEATAIGEEGTYLITLSPVTNGQPGMSVRTYTIAIDDDANKLILTAQGNDLEPLSKGEYRLSISAGAYFVDNAVNEAVSFDYEVTDGAVSGIFADAESFTVYTATGICVLRNADAADVDLLPAGLYIINGKKVIVRK